MGLTTRNSATRGGAKKPERAGEAHATGAVRSPRPLSDRWPSRLEPSRRKTCTEARHAGAGAALTTSVSSDSVKRLRDFLDYLWPAPVQAILRELLITIIVLGALVLVAQLHQPAGFRPAVRNTPYVRHIRLLPYIVLTRPSPGRTAPTLRPRR